MVPVLQHQCGSQGSETSPSMLLLLAQVEAQRWCGDGSDGEFMRFHPTQNLDVLGHICLGLCPDCDYTLLFWRLPIWYLLFPRDYRYILDPYYRHTHVSSPPPLFQAIHAQQKNMAELLGTATKTYIPCCQRRDRYLLWEMCPAAKVHRVRWLRQFKGPFLCHRWWIPGVVLVILTVGFPQFWWIFLRSLGWFSLGLENRLKFVPVEPLLCDFPNTRRRQSRALPMEVGSDALERCTSHVADTPGHSPTWKNVSSNILSKNDTIQGLHGPLPYPVSMIDLVWICRGTGVMVSSEIEDFQYVLTFV